MKGNLGSLPLQNKTSFSLNKNYLYNKKINKIAHLIFDILVCTAFSQLHNYIVTYRLNMRKKQVAGFDNDQSFNLLNSVFDLENSLCPFWQDFSLCLSVDTSSSRVFSFCKIALIPLSRLESFAKANNINSTAIRTLKGSNITEC